MSARGIQHPVRAILLGGSKDKRQEDGQNGLPSVPGIRHPVGGGIQTVDDGRRVILLGEKESASTVFGVWVGDGAGVAASPPTYS